MLERLLRIYSTTIDFRESLFHLGITALLCFCAGILYLSLSRNKVQALRFARLFPLMGMGMALVAAVLGSSLTVAIGLVGAVSVVRYRGVFHDLQQLTFFFLIVALGLAGGTGQLGIALLGFPMIALALLLRSWWQKRRGRLDLRLTGAPSEVQALLPQLQRDFPRLRLQNVHLDATAAEWRFSLFHPQPGDAIALQTRLAHAPGLHFSLLEDLDAQ
jgi:hypothetical protein